MTTNNSMGAETVVLPFDITHERIPTGELSLFNHVIELGKAHEKTGALPGAGFAEFIEMMEPHISPLCQKLGLNELQAVLFSDIVCLYEGREIALKTLASFIDCKPVMLMQEIDELRNIEDKNLMLIADDSRSHGRGIEFALEIETLEALKNNLLPDNNIKNLSVDDFFTQVVILFESTVQGRLRYSKTIERMKKLLAGNAHLWVVKMLKAYELSADDELILLRFCHYFIDLDIDEMEFRTLEALYPGEISRFRGAKQQFRSGTHKLQKEGLVQSVYDDGFSDTEAFCLTDKAKNELLFEVEYQFSRKALHKITTPDTITQKEMFYPEKTERQVAELAGLLQNEKFAAVQERLSLEGMRTGFACLFSGSPGTGKTETAYQIARLTGRGIIQVDISDTKSKWFGESEKKIKSVFTQYRAAVKQSAVTPILLFNEADAIIGKRQNLNEEHNGIRQTENTIQNIILSEIENLNGILIATTNLAKNMDKAFERRFLYKIEFENPGLDARKSIWRTLVPALSPDEIDCLTGKFNFSGGQIENIARRRTVAEVVYGSPPSLETLIEYCKEEMQEGSGVAMIGFCAGQEG